MSSKNNQGHTSALYIWNGLSMFWGTSFHTSPHSHNTLQLVFDIDKQFKLKDENSDWQHYSNAIIKAEHVHQLDSCGSIQLFIYLDQESELAKKLSQKYLKESSIVAIEDLDVTKLSSNFFKKLLVQSDCQSLLKGCQFILNRIIELEKPNDLDDRVKAAIHFITTSKDKQFKVSMVAEHVCLSESRLRHLFKQQVGQPIQNFILWMKVIDSLNLVLKGKPIGESALDSGFWDNSHMNRSYKELLGAAPGQLKAYEKELKIVACSEGNLHRLRTDVRDSYDTDNINQTISI